MSFASSRAPRLTLIVVAVAVTGALLGCRTPVPVEGNLPLEPFEKTSASLIEDPAGQWYVVANIGEEPRDFLTVEFDDTTHLFAALDQGKRSAKLFPLTPVSMDWFDQAKENRALLKFHENLNDISVDSTLGLWSGDEAAGVRWLSPAPDAPTRSVAVPLELDQQAVSLPSQITAIVDLDAKSIFNAQGSHDPEDGPYLLIPDGPLAESGPRSAAPRDFAELNTDRVDWSWDEISGYQVSNDAEHRELTGELGVEFLITRQGEDFRAGFAADGAAPGRGEWRRPVALAESGFILAAGADEGTRRMLVDAIDDLYRDHPLSAAYRLQRTWGAWHVNGNERATTLRHQDLVGGAGYAPWMRSAILQGQNGMGPEASLYMARSYAHGGDWEAVEMYAQRAIELFQSWPRQPGAIGMARARKLISDAHMALYRHDSANEHLLRARADFIRADDPYRAALVERHRLLRRDTTSLAAVVDEFDEMGARYEASRTQLLRIAVDIEHHRYDSASQQLNVWTERFGPDAPTRLLLLSRALHHRLTWLQGGRVESQRLTEDARNAEYLRAWEALLTFTLTQHGRRAMYDEMDIGGLGELLVEGTLRSDSMLFAEEIDATLGVICADVVFSTGKAHRTGLVERQCHQRIAQSMNTTEGVLSVLEGGFRFIQRGELMAAETLDTYLFEALESKEDPAWATTQARAHLFRAALLGELRVPDRPGGAESEDHRVTEAIQQSFDILATHLTGEQAPTELRSLGDEYDARGFDVITAALYQAAGQAAANSNRQSDAYEVALTLAEFRARVASWDDLASMENVRSPLHAARIDLYRGHAEFMRDNYGNGRQLTELGLQQAGEFGDSQRISVLYLAARLATERGAIDEALSYIERGKTILIELPESRAETETVRLLEGQLYSQQALLILLNGDRRRAGEYGRRAMAVFRDLPMESAVKMLPDVIEVRALTTDDEAQFSALVNELDELNRRLPKDISTRRQRDIIHSLARLLSEDGKSADALKRVRSVIGDGIALSGRRQEHHCAVGTARLFAGDRDLAKFHIRRCTADGPVFVPAIRAQFYLAFADPQASASYRIELARHLYEQLPTTVPAQRAWLDWIIASSEWSADVDTETHEALLAASDPADGNGNLEEQARQLEATVDLASYLLDTAQYGEVDRLLQSESAIFFEPEMDAEFKWLELQIRSKIRQIRPFDAFEYIDRALSEKPPPSGERSALLHYYRAVAHLQLGQPFPSLRAIERGRAEVAEMEDSAEVESKFAELESAIDLIRSSR